MGTKIRQIHVNNRFGNFTLSPLTAQPASNIKTTGPSFALTMTGTIERVRSVVKKCGLFTLGGLICYVTNVTILSSFTSFDICLI